MTKYLTMHPINPQPRLIKQAVELLLGGGLISYPTDSGYAFGCALESRKALTTLRNLRQLSENHPLTLLCHSISEVSEYCVLSNQNFKILKNFTPGPYTFILPATKRVPRQAQGKKQKAVGIRIPLHPVALALVVEMGTPLLSSTLWFDGDPEPLSDPLEIKNRTRGELALILDVGLFNSLPSSVIDLTADRPKIIRQGLGDTSSFEEHN